MIGRIISRVNGLRVRANRFGQDLLAKFRVRPTSFDGAPCDLWKLSFSSLDECKELLNAHAKLFHERRLMEHALLNRLEGQEVSAIAGVCWVCSRVRYFYYDRKYSDGANVNWRERLVCDGCGLNNRLRMSMQVIERMTAKECSIYLTEQVTPLAMCLARRHRKLEMSEYLGDNLPAGRHGLREIRHEDITSLSFKDSSFDIVLSFDVLEHVPDYRMALKEFHRVLNDGGQLILSVPFSLLSKENIVRARLKEDGEVEHVLAPEYHGDPVDPHGGILCYYHFGWQLIEELKLVGFREARVDSYWSRAFAHIGDEQLMIVAVR